MFYVYLIVIFYIVCLMGIVLYCDSILTLLISLEFLVVYVLLLLLNFYASDGLLETFIFLVLVVGESLLGLILLLFKVNTGGGDVIEFKNVF